MTLWIDIAGCLRKVELPTYTSNSIPIGEIACLVDGRALKLDLCPLTPGLLSLIPLDSSGEGPNPTTHSARQYRCILEVSPEGEAVIINGQRTPFANDDPRSLRGRRGARVGAVGPQAVKSPMPGRVLRILVALGEEVAAHQGLIVIEAMKMQNELKSPKPGRIARIAAKVGETVQSGEVLIVVE